MNLQYADMQPNTKLITISNNEEQIVDFIKQMLIMPRKAIHEWSKITNQTPNLKIGYPGQHLASLILGMKGNATGARGEDICDGSEVKSCSKVDQSDKCKDCHENVLRSESFCSNCGSTNIKRNNDSKWLIPVRSDDELRMLLEETPRYVFIVTDYPKFCDNNFCDIRIRAFEVWVQSERCKNFRILMENYYNYIYKEHIKKNPNKTPAPKNIFPDNFPFYMCNPIKIFECNIKDSLSKNPQPIINYYVKPNESRLDLKSEIMPIELLKPFEKEILKQHDIDLRHIVGIDEEMRDFLSLRDTDKSIKTIGTKKHKKVEQIVQI